MATSEPLDYELIVMGLTDIGDRPEWQIAALHRILTPWIKDRVKFAFNSPKQFNTEGTVNPRSFTKVLKQLGPEGTLSEAKLIALIEQFTLKCSKSDWDNFYQPILKRENRHKLKIGELNAVLSEKQEKYRIKLFEPQTHEIAYPSGPGFFFPFNEDCSRIFVIVDNDQVDVVGEDFSSYGAGFGHAFYPLRNQSSLTYPIVFEGIVQGFEVFLTDVFELGQIDVWPGELRRQILEDAYMNVLQTDDQIVLGEGYPGDVDTDLDDVGMHLHGLGYRKLNQVLFKPADAPYTAPAYIVPIHDPAHVDARALAD